MKKKIAIGLASLLILNTVALASMPSLENFVKVNTYETDVYTDVLDDLWYTQGVKNSYEYGLLTGIEDGKFGMNTNITIAQTLAIASRLHSIYTTGEENFEQGVTWYQVYVDYAINNNLISYRQFSDYNKIATRTEFVGILYYALYYASYQFGGEPFEIINEGIEVPDVKEGDYYYNAIFALYEAGILTGSDEYKTFNPSHSILREEVATIVSRIVLPKLRVEM